MPGHHTVLLLPLLLTVSVILDADADETYHRLNLLFHKAVQVVFRLRSRQLSILLRSTRKEQATQLTLLAHTLLKAILLREA